MSKRKKIIMIGLDGADPELMKQWADAGDMPTIRSLYDRATWCAVKNPPGLFAGAVCPSFYTGVSPARHGKFCSHQLKSGTYDFVRVQRPDPACDMLWDVLAQQDRKVAIIDAPKSHLAKGLNGLHVVDWAAEDFPIDLDTWPEELAAELVHKYGRNDIVETAIAAEGDAGLAKLGDLLASRLRRKVDMTADLLARDEWDFFFSLLTEVHTAGHLAWHLHDTTHPRHDPQTAQRIGNIVRDVYIATDAALRRFIDMAGPDVHVFIYSINGMGASHTGNHILDDVLMAADRRALPPARRALAGAVDWVERQTPGRIYDAIAPLRLRTRRALSLPVRELPWRQAFRVPSNSVAGGVRINLAGREPSGIVPAERYDELCADLQRLLGSLRYSGTDISPVRRVIKTRDRYSGPYLDELPDLLVEWTQASPVSSVWSQATGTVQRSYGGHRTGDHRADGILFSVGDGQGRGEVDAVSIYDLAPTLAAMVGAKFPAAEGTDRSVGLGVDRAA